MKKAPAVWKRLLHLMAGFVPLAYGVWRWSGPLSIHTLIIAGGLFFTAAVVLAGGRAVKFLAEFTQAAITLAFLDLALRHVKIPELWNVVRQLDPLLILAGMFTFAIGVWFRGYRWYFLLEGKGKVRRRDAVFATYISYFGNFALPARAGELIRIVALGERTGISKAAATASVLMEKISDLLMLVLVILCLLGFTGLGGPTLRFIVGLGAVIAVVLISMMVAAIVLRRLYPLRSEGAVAGSRSKIRQFLHGFVEGMRPASRPAHMGRFLLYSLVAWGFISCACYIFLASQGLIDWLRDFGRAGPIASTLLLVVLVNASTLIPAGPGSAGPYQAAVMLAFALIGAGSMEAGSVEYHNAAAFSILLWIGQAFPSMIVGGMLFFRSGLTVQILRTAEREAAEAMMPPDG